VAGTTYSTTKTAQTNGSEMKSIAIKYFADEAHICNLSAYPRPVKQSPQEADDLAVLSG
jgi:hypothetical protein